MSDFTYGLNEEKINNIPQDIAEEVIVLTNTYNFLYKYAKRNKLTKEEFLNTLSELKKSKAEISFKRAKEFVFSLKKLLE